MKNIAEILKNCPKGTKLYSSLCGECFFDEIQDNTSITIIFVKTQDGSSIGFYSDGTYVKTGECLLFPSKDNRDWDKFCPFKDGDIIFEGRCHSICIFKKEGSIKGTVDYYCGTSFGKLHVKDGKNIDEHYGDISDYRLATEEEKQKLFDAIKTNGYKWNAETKTLEKLKCTSIQSHEVFGYKVDDIVFVKHIGWVRITNKLWDSYSNEHFYEAKGLINEDEYDSISHKDIEAQMFSKTVDKDEVNNEIVMSGIYFDREHYADEVELHLGDYEIEIRNGKTYAVYKKLKTKTLEKLIEPKFKVGDRIKDKNNRVWFVVQVSDKHFDISSVPNAEGYFVPIEDQDDYELVPNKFDISTLKPFDKVLVRDRDGEWWKPRFFGYLIDSSSKYYGKFVTIDDKQWLHCIPFEGNEQLVKTSNDCDEYYKTW